MTRCSLFPIWLTLLLAVMGGTSPKYTPATDPTPLACPGGAVTWLRGTSAPAAPLVARFAGRVVGGVSPGPHGAWGLPITVRERPGVYPVVVEQRDDGVVVAAFTCFVDLPAGATLTPLPTARPTLTPGSDPQPLSPPVSASPLAVATVTAGAAGTASMPGGMPPHSKPFPSETVTGIPEGTTPGAPPPTPTTPGAAPPQPADTVAILGVQPHNPAQPELFEYVLIANLLPLPQRLDGWVLAHLPSGAIYRLPAVTLPPEGLVAIWSGPGLDDPTTGTLYWPTNQGRWAVGDRAELYSPDGRLVSSLPVAPESDTHRDPEGAP